MSRDVVSEFYFCLGQVLALAKFSEVEATLAKRGADAADLQRALREAAETAYRGDWDDQPKAKP